MILAAFALYVAVSSVVSYAAAWALIHAICWVIDR